MKVCYRFVIKNVKNMYTLKIFFPFAVFLRYYRNGNFLYRIVAFFVRNGTRAFAAFLESHFMLKTRKLWRTQERMQKALTDR